MFTDVSEYVSEYHNILALYMLTLLSLCLHFWLKVKQLLFYTFDARFIAL